MNNSPLIIKSKEFALDIIKVCNTVKQTKKETVLTNQLIRSGTSIGANIRNRIYLRWITKYRNRPFGRFFYFSFRGDSNPGAVEKSSGAEYPRYSYYKIRVSGFIKNRDTL